VLVAHATWKDSDGILPDAATYVQRPQHSKFLPQRVAQSIESSNKIYEVQVCKSFRQWWYATKNTQAIIRCKSNQTQCNPQCLVLNPFQTQHMRLCHIRKRNRAIFQDRSNESPKPKQETPVTDLNKFTLWRLFRRTFRP
jgi:hypothetical protein